MSPFIFYFLHGYCELLNTVKWNNTWDAVVFFRTTSHTQILYVFAPTFVLIILTFAFFHFTARLTLSLVTHQTVHTIPALLSGATTLTLKQISGCMRSVELSKFIGPCRLNTTNCHYFLPSVCFLRDAVWKNRKKSRTNEIDGFYFPWLQHGKTCGIAAIIVYYLKSNKKNISAQYLKGRFTLGVCLSVCPHSYLELNKFEGKI